MPAVAVDPLASFARSKRALEHLQFINAIHGNEAQNRWVAISLADGACDQRIYATKAEAVRFQKRETECAYLFFNGMPTAGELRYFLDENERLYDSGASLADPDTYVNPETFL